MPHALADALYRHLLERFPPDRDYPRGALYAEGMPPLVASLLGRTLDRWLEHKLEALNSAWFDFDDPAVQAARAELVAALGRTARVPRAAWADTLQYAVGLVVRHLVTPARALTDATFEGETEGTLPAAVLRERLHTFEAYPYLPEIAVAYLEQKGTPELDPDGLFRLLQRVDRRVTTDYGAADWLRLLAPLFKLARAVPTLGGVPAPDLAAFFEAKGRDDLADRLDALGETALDEAALHDLLVEVLGPSAPEPDRSSPLAPAAAPPAPPSQPAADRPPPERPEAERPEAERPGTERPERPPTGSVPAESAPEAEGASEATRSPAPEPPSDEPAPEAAREERPPDPAAAAEDRAAPNRADEEDEPQPLWKRFAAGHAQPSPVPLSPAPPPPPRSRAEAEADAEARPLWQRFLAGLRAPASPDTPVPQPTEGDTDHLEALERRVLGPTAARRRRRFVRDLFGGDEAAYAATLARLDAAPSWTEASRIIAEDVFRAHGVDIYAETAVTFTDAVQARFGS